MNETEILNRRIALDAAVRSTTAPATAAEILDAAKTYVAFLQGKDTASNSGAVER